MRSKIATTLIAAFLFAGSIGSTWAIVDDARSFAIEAALPWLEGKDGEKPPFVIRDAWWNGDAVPGKAKIFRHQLFKRNEYWFWGATSNTGAKISVAVYDEAGKLVKSAESFAKDHTAGVKIIPERTGTYFIRVVVEAPKKTTPHWALIYGYR